MLARMQVHHKATQTKHLHTMANPETPICLVTCFLIGGNGATQ